MATPATSFGETMPDPPTLDLRRAHLLCLVRRRHLLHREHEVAGSSPARTAIPPLSGSSAGRAHVQAVSPTLISGRAPRSPAPYHSHGRVAGKHPSGAMTAVPSWFDPMRGLEQLCSSIGRANRSHPDLGRDRTQPGATSVVTSSDIPGGPAALNGRHHHTHRDLGQIMAFPLRPAAGRLTLDQESLVRILEGELNSTTQ